MIAKEVRQACSWSLIQLEPAMVYRLTEDEREAFNSGRLSADQGAFFSGARADVSLVDYEDEALEPRDLDCLELLSPRLAGMRITFDKKLPEKQRLQVIEMFRENSCDVELQSHGFLAALHKHFQMEQYQWWLTLFGLQSPYGSSNEETGNQIEVLQRRLPRRENSFWYAGEVARYRKYHLVVSGNVTLRFHEKGSPDGSDLYYDDEARAEAKERQLTDRDLRRAVHWYSNNWFEVVNERWATVSDESAETWTQGMELLRRLSGAPSV